MHKDTPSMIHVIEPSQILVYQQHEQCKTIDLKHLILKKGWLILSLMVLGGAITGGLSLKSKPSYKEVTHLSEPSIKQYEDLYANTNSKISSGKLFNLFLSKLSNQENFNAFKKEFLLSSPKQREYLDSLRSNVVVSKIKKLSLSYSYSKISEEADIAELNLISPVNLSQDIAKKYIDFTNREILNEISEKQHEALNVKIKNIEQQYNVRFDALKKQHLFEIEKLKNQIEQVTHEKSTADKPKQLAYLQEQLKSKDYDLQALVNQHISNDKSLNQAESTLTHLKALPFDASHISSFTIDSTAPVVEIKPNFKLVIAAGAMVGLVMAIFIVLLQTVFLVRHELTEEVKL